MARPREFIEGEALGKAMDVFWSKGYEATSLADLTKAMGLSKSSLYDTFGNKHELYLAAMDRYNETVASRTAAAIIDDAGGGKKGIAAVFHRFVESMTGGDERRGCFVGNSAIELGSHDDDAAKRVCAGLACMEKSFRDAVETAQAAGDIPADRDALALARYLTAALNGLIVVAKARPEPKALKDVARMTLRALD